MAAGQAGRDDLNWPARRPGIAPDRSLRAGQLVQTGTATARLFKAGRPGEFDHYLPAHKVMTDWKAIKMSIAQFSSTFFVLLYFTIFNLICLKWLFNNVLVENLILPKFFARFYFV